MKYVGCQWRIIHRYRFDVDRRARIPDNRAYQRHAGANPLGTRILMTWLLVQDRQSVLANSLHWSMKPEH